MVFLIVGAYVYNFSYLSGNWLISLFLGVLFGWAICAPIIRICYGEVRFLIIFAALPPFVLPLVLIIKSLPSKSLLFVPVLLIFPILSFSYISWLNGMEFFALFKRRNWSRRFSKSKQDNPKEKWKTKRHTSSYTSLNESMSNLEHIPSLGDNWLFMETLNSVKNKTWSHFVLTAW